MAYLPTGASLEDIIGGITPPPPPPPKKKAAKSSIWDDLLGFGKKAAKEGSKFLTERERRRAAEAEAAASWSGGGGGGLPSWAIPAGIGVAALLFIRSRK